MNVYDKLKKNGITLDPVEEEMICKRFKVKELSIFGSVLRDDFHADSDVDGRLYEIQ
jgi:predicted nucleotidyltransferase